MIFKLEFGCKLINWYDSVLNSTKTRNCQLYTQEIATSIHYMQKMETPVPQRHASYKESTSVIKLLRHRISNTEPQTQQVKDTSTKDFDDSGS